MVGVMRRIALANERCSAPAGRMSPAAPANRTLRPGGPRTVTAPVGGPAW